jgi:hypothetical protein
MQCIKSQIRCRFVVERQTYWPAGMDFRSWRGVNNRCCLKMYLWLTVHLFVCLFLDHSRKWLSNEKSEGFYFLRYDFMTLGNVFQTLIKLVFLRNVGKNYPVTGRHSFIHLFIFFPPNDRCVALPKRLLLTVGSSASSFHLQHFLRSLRPFCTWLRRLPRLPVTYFVCHSFNIPKERNAPIRRCTEWKSASITDPEPNDSDTVTTESRSWCMNQQMTDFLTVLKWHLGHQGMWRLASEAMRNSLRSAGRPVDCA